MADRLRWRSLRPHAWATGTLEGARETRRLTQPVARRRSEDGEAKAALTAQLLAARESGTLRSDAHSALLAAALAPVATTPPQPDGLLRFGDVRVLASSTGGALAACTRDALNPPAARAAAAALSASSSPVARSCVVLERRVRAPVSVNAARSLTAFAQHCAALRGGRGPRAGAQPRR